MKYNLTVKEFLEQSESGDVDYSDFIGHLKTELHKAQKKYDLFQCISDSKETPKPSLFGLPVSVKDNICVKGLQSSAGSRILSGYIPPFDATCVERLKKESALVIGKTNQDEFGFGTFSVNSGYGIPKNPLDETLTCGGSSGGAAGLVAALQMPHIAIAESTGGSISCPAAFCSVVGLTPTYGLVSRYGLIDYANSLDKIGPIGKSVHDVALALSKIAGHDDNDSTSIKKETLNKMGYPQRTESFGMPKNHRFFEHALTTERSEGYDYTKSVSARSGLKGIRIGVPAEYFTNIDKAVEKSVRASIEKMEGMGAAVKEISMPQTRFSLASYYIIATAEASTNLARYCGIRYGLHLEMSGDFNEYFSKVRSAGFGEEAKRRIILGTFARMSGYRDAYYIKAMKVRTLIINEFKKAFKSFDVLAAPTMPILPPKFSEIKKLTPAETYQMDILTVPPNLAGIPMISLPAEKGKPIGLHLMAGHLEEAKLLEVAGVFERNMG